MASAIEVMVIEDQHVETADPAAGVARQLKVDQIVDYKNITRPDNANIEAVINYKGRDEGFLRQFAVADTAAEITTLIEA